MRLHRTLMEALTRRLKQVSNEPVGPDRQVNYARE